MFRNVIGAQEAAVHRQSNDSLLNENHRIKLIEDIQSVDVSQTYVELKTKWLQQREKLINKLKHLETNRGHANEIQHMKSLIQCFNELIESGEVKTNCQTLLDYINDDTEFIPSTPTLEKKPLGEKTIRLPRHSSKSTTFNLLNPLKKIKQKQKQQDGESSTSDSTGSKTKSGIQYYVVAEQFRNQNVKKTGKKHYLSTSILE